MFPQEICIKLPQPQSVNGFRFSGFGIKDYELQVAEGATASGFQPSYQGQTNSTGRLQFEQQSIDGRFAQYVKLVIKSGWTDFVSVHQVHVN